MDTTNLVAVSEVAREVGVTISSLLSKLRQARSPFIIQPYQAEGIQMGARKAWVTQEVAADLREYYRRKKARN
jgi:transposase-like protein